MTLETPQKLVIGWLYGTKMNIYGDRGNVVALEQRAKWRGIEVEVRDIGINQQIPDDIDIFFWGGGQDQEQVSVAHDLAGAKAEALKAAIEGGAAMLAICGGYQLLGNVYHPHDGDVLPGVGVFDIESIAGPERFIGNVVIESEEFGSLVGFENHSGLTRLQGEAKPLGKVVIGNGNNGQDGTEGAIYKNAIGCYLHGSLLPKNPKVTDWLLQAGLRHRYGQDVELAPLDDAIEVAAHKSASLRAQSA